MHKTDPLKRLFHHTRRFAAKKWFNYIRPYTIGITGSMGKTYTTYILSKLYKNAIVTDLNLDTIYNIPITALKLTKNSKLAIFEYGIDQVGEMNKHLQIAKPNVVIVTGITGVHTDSEHLGSLENLIAEKRKLVECLKEDDYAILNYDDENVRNMATHTKAKVVFFGSDPSKCAITFNPQETKLSLNGTTFEVTDQEEGLTFKLKTKLFGTQFVYNLMAAYLTYKLIESRNESYKVVIIWQFEDIISKIQPLKGRMSFDKIAGYEVLDDSLRSNPSSIKNGLETFTQIELNPEQRKILVLGEMGELGSSETEEHELLGKYISKMNQFEYYIGIGPLQELSINSAVKNGLNKDKTFYAKNAIEAGLALKQYLEKGDVIYLKGSLLRHMERIIMTISQEGVNCDVVSCPLYNSCRVCKFRYSKYSSK